MAISERKLLLTSVLKSVGLPSPAIGGERPDARAALQPIEWAADAGGSDRADMRVNHGSAELGMSQEFLNRADVFTVFEQVCGKAMSKCMTADFLMNSGSADGAL